MAQLLRAAMWLVVSMAGIAATAAITALAAKAHAEVRQCTAQQVEYLIGGTGKASTSGSSGSKTCTHSAAGSQIGSVAESAKVRNPNAPTANPVHAIKFDDAGRREILSQELRLAQQALLELDRSQMALAGAGTLHEQRTRRQGDITALESELGRLKSP